MLSRRLLLLRAAAADRGAMVERAPAVRRLRHLVASVVVAADGGSGASAQQQPTPRDILASTPLTQSHPFLRMLGQHRSIRKFDTEKDVSEEMLEAVLSCAAAASSSGNMQVCRHIAAAAAAAAAGPTSHPLACLRVACRYGVTIRTDLVGGSEPRCGGAKGAVGAPWPTALRLGSACDPHLLL